STACRSISCSFCCSPRPRKASNSPRLPLWRASCAMPRPRRACAAPPIAMRPIACWSVEPLLFLGLVDRLGDRDDVLVRRLGALLGELLALRGELAEIDDRVGVLIRVVAIEPGPDQRN